MLEYNAQLVPTPIPLKSCPHDVLIGEDDAVRTLDHRFLVPSGEIARD